MAKSSSHKFGQMIGDLLELVMIQQLYPIANKYGMYLDYKHPRPARNNTKEVIWRDCNQNKHKLDIVIEQDGSDYQYGKPKAFIEMAWRRYAKHSKNKAQEISGAILPLIQEYSRYSPFYGVVLAGVFTTPSIKQLLSEGFRVLYFDISTIINAFATVGIDVEWKEDTAEEKFESYVRQFESLNEEQLGLFVSQVLQANADQLEAFKVSLTQAFDRRIEKIRIFALHGKSVELCTVQEAIDFIMGYREEVLENGTFVTYEIYARYTNGDKVEATLKEKEAVISFLSHL